MSVGRRPSSATSTASREDVAGGRFTPSVLRPSRITSGGGDRGANSISDPFDVFTVEFPSSGPLGITFEWAVDFTTPVSARPSQTADAPNTTAITTTTTATWYRAGAEKTSSSPAIFAGEHRSSTNVNVIPEVRDDESASPRALLTPTVLPPISLPSVVPDPSVVPHALRIQSFPQLPGESDLRPAGRRSATPTSATHSPVVRTADVLQRSHAFTTADGVLADMDARRPTYLRDEESSTDEPSFSAAFDGAATWEPAATTVTAAAATATAATAATAAAVAEVALGSSKAVGLAAARDVLRIGDILVEVNGNPVAGPAARHAGITTFQDAVQVIADAATDAISGTGAAGRGRLFTFKRERWSISPPSPSAAPLLPPAVLTLKGKWVGEGSGGAEQNASPGVQPTAEVGSGSGTASGTAPRVSKSHLQPWVPQLQGLTRPSGSRGGERMAGGSSRRVSALGSPRLMSPLGSDRSLEGGGHRKEGSRSRARGEASSVCSVSSTADRLKADAR